jgi:hypothetical protein
MAVNDETELHIFRKTFDQFAHGTFRDAHLRLALDALDHASGCVEHDDRDAAGRTGWIVRRVRLHEERGEKQYGPKSGRQYFHGKVIAIHSVTFGLISYSNLPRFFATCSD